jgi:hypothetical protein
MMFRLTIRDLLWTAVRLAAALVLLSAAPAAAQSPGGAPVSYDTTTYDGQEAVVVTTGQGGGIAHPTHGTDVTWTSDYVWVLDGLVFVNEGQTLRLDPGTVVKGKTGDGKNASALVVARGGQIFAEGTAAKPIIFTTVKDDLSTTDELPPNFRGGWGGLIVMGRAPLNTTPNVLNVEGITINEVRNQYGGSDPDDSSGVLRYVSVRYGGTILEEGNEINGITFAGVGSGTTVEYVEVFNNQDDGFEFFGGTVNTRYLISAFTTDDSFDVDQGYRGVNQFWLAVQNSVYADHAGEHDGGESEYGGEDSKPYATPQMYNATYVGSGLDGSGSTALNLRDNFAGSYFNSIFVSFPENVVYIEDREGDTTGDSRARFEEGTLQLKGNLFHEIAGTFMAGTGSSYGGLVANDGTFGTEVATYLQEHNALVSASPVKTLARDSYGTLTELDPRAAGEAVDGGDAGSPESDFVQSVDYTGAFGPTDNWAVEWSFLGKGGSQHPGLGILR